MGLAAPRLIDHLIEAGITPHHQAVLDQTPVVILAISGVSASFAVDNYLLSAQVGASMARDLREAMLRKIQSFSFGKVDRLRTGQLLVRLTSDTSAPLM